VHHNVVPIDHFARLFRESYTPYVYGGATISHIITNASLAACGDSIRSLNERLQLNSGHRLDMLRLYGAWISEHRVVPSSELARGLEDDTSFTRMNFAQMATAQPSIRELVVNNYVTLIFARERFLIYMATNQPSLAQIHSDYPWTLALGMSSIAISHRGTLSHVIEHV